MGIFQVEKKILKYCGIERYPSRRMKYVFNVLKVWNYFIWIYCVFASAYYIIGTKDILDIAESLSSSTTAFIMLIKYTVFCSRTEEIFGFMDKVEELNENCKKVKKNYFPKCDKILI